MNGLFGLLAFVVAWFVAQVWKTLGGLLSGQKRGEKMSLGAAIDYFTRSGGMPSGHSASMVALTTFLGIAGGFESGLFALALASTIIVVYDATHVRYAVGVQGDTLNEILEKEGEKPIKVIRGHTMLQVVVGTLIGIITGVIVGFLVKA